MAANKLNVGMLANVASDGNEGVSDQHVLTYVAANNSVEFKELNLSISGTGTVSSNADSVNTSTASDIDTVQDNVATTLTSLDAANTSIDTVEANLATFAAYANTNYASDAANSFATITVGEANVVASGTSNTLVFTSGNGISVTANAASQSITFDVNIGNVASEYYVLDGTANTVTLSKDYRPANTLYVTVGGLVQEPGINYITDSTTLTLINTYPILNGTDVEVRYLPYTGEIAASTPTGSGSQSGAQGTSFGYVSGGSPGHRVIEKFAFSSSITLVDVGDFLTDTIGAAGTSSLTHGYVAAGSGSPFYDGRNVIEKFPFSSDTNATDVGDLTAPKIKAAGQESSTHGYVSGGVSGSPIVTNGLDTIEKFSFSADGNGTDVGELTVSKHERAGQSSSTHGYTSGGYNGQDPTITDVIEKFLFSSDSNSTDVGNLSTVKHLDGGHQSSTHGYAAGGNQGPPAKVSAIDKFPFSSDTDATDIGNLTAARSVAAASSSTEHGYTSGGTTGPEGYNTDIVDRFAFSSDADATDVGELSAITTNATGHQV